MNKTEATIEGTLAAIGQKTTVIGASTTGAGWVFSSEFLGFAGLVIALLGLLVNVYFRLKEDRRQQALHDAEMATLKAGVRHE